MAIENADVRGLVQALKELGHLDGLYEAARVEVQGLIATASVDPDPEKARARLAELVAKHPDLAAVIKDK